VIALFSGCNSSVVNGLINEADKTCKTDARPGCVISLKTATKFKWERMYLFGAWTISDSITRVIGFKYNGDDVPDDNTRMLFFDSNKVVYEEDFESLDYYDSAISFRTDTDIFYMGRHYLTPLTAVFKVAKDKTEHSCKECFFYSLKPVKTELH
jgi:hypothetical protein